jgi:acetyl-CoA synthetase
MEVRTQIGPFATPKRIIIVQDLPKTRSGKIMRRILRKLVNGDISKEEANNDKILLEKLGDLSTLADPNVINGLINKIF